LNKFILNPGPLSSSNSLSYYLGPQLDEIRNLYRHGSSPLIVLDLRHLNSGSINITALASLLSICRKLSLFLGQPLETYFTLNTNVQAFLNHVEFFYIAEKLNILVWDKRTVGGFWSGNYSFNPATKLLYFGDVFDSIEDKTPGEVLRIKALRKQKIGPNFSLRCSEIFKGVDPQLEYTVENTALELITNSLIHGKDYAFVGMQRTSSRITVSVCDSGIGFKKSLSLSYPTNHCFQRVNNTQSLIIGSLIQRQEHGLRLAINQVLNYDDIYTDSTNEGWVIISSFDSEIRWQKNNWERALQYYERIDMEDSLPEVNLILGEEIKRKMSLEELIKGYRKTYDYHLVGTRITFEIPIY